MRRHTDGVEQTIYRKVPLLSRQYVLYAEVIQEVPVALAFGRDCVPKDSLLITKVVSLAKKNLQLAHSQFWGYSANALP